MCAAAACGAEEGAQGTATPPEREPRVSRADGGNVGCGVRRTGGIFDVTQLELPDVVCDLVGDGGIGERVPEDVVRAGRAAGRLSSPEPVCLGTSRAMPQLCTEGCTAVADRQRRR